MRTEELDNMNLKGYVPTSGIPDGIAGVVCMYLPTEKYPRTMSADISSADHISSGVITDILFQKLAEQHNRSPIWDAVCYTLLCTP